MSIGNDLAHRKGAKDAKEERRDTSLGSGVLSLESEGNDPRLPLRNPEGSSRATEKGNGVGAASAGTSMFRFALLLLLTCFCLGTISCKKSDEIESHKSQSEGTRKEYTQGPLLVRIMVDKDSLGIAEHLILTIEAEIEDGYELELPGFGEKLGDFGILDYREDPPELTGEHRIVTRRVYKLEPFLSGDYRIAPMSVTFRKKPSGEGQDREQRDSKGEIQSEEVTIKVRSLLGEDKGQLRIDPIFGPVDLPAQPVSMALVLIVLASFALGAGAVLLWLRRRGKKPAKETTPTLPAHELAFKQLQEILDGELLDRGEFKLFFARISDVVRYYIENRFGVHAPKLTTEEFLDRISWNFGRNVAFSSRHQRLLDEFLHHCDLVKFAEHLPTQDEIGKTIDACKAFIHATKTVD